MNSAIAYFFDCRIIEGVKNTLFILALLFWSLSALGQQGALQGTSTLGGISATTQGSQSSNKLMGVIPAAKITIYLTGTTTLATLTTDGTHSLANPFYSNASTAVNPGGYVAFAAIDQGYDIVASSGQGVPNCTTGPLCYAQPVTLCKDCYPSHSFTPVVNPLEVETNGVGNADQTVLNHVDSATVKFTNPSGGIEQASVVLANGVTMYLTPPASGQYVLVYPTAVATTQANSMTTTAGDTSGEIVSGPYCSFGGTGSITWTAPALPSYVLAANVTAVYAFSVTENGSDVPSGNCFSTPRAVNHALGDIEVTGTGISSTSVQPGGVSPRHMAVAADDGATLRHDGREFSLVHDDSFLCGYRRLHGGHLYQLSVGGLFCLLYRHCSSGR